MSSATTMPSHPGLKSKHNQASAIVADMTLAEKARFCSGKSFWHLEALERHDIPNVMVTDGPHGLRKQDRGADHVGLNRSVPATCFPTACALAASWDVDLLEEIGVALGQECATENVTVLLGPGVNIKRHPFCGRNFEYYSEDPLLTGKLAAALINGVQSQNVGTSIKHFAVNNQEHGRMYVDAIVDERTLREIYLRGFEIAIKEAQPWTVMCAYNRVNGTYCSEHHFLLNEVLRDEWGFEGLVVTDWGAANNRIDGLQSGLDLEMPGGSATNDEHVQAAVQSGELAESTLNTAIQRNVSLSLLGADLQARADTVDLDANHQLAKRAARESAVLLKNENSLLPLRQDQNIAVVGAFAKHPRYQGAGSSQVNPTRLDTAWDALQELVPDLSYAAGYEHKHSAHDPALIEEAVAVARAAEAVIVFAGLPGIYESEGFDRSHMSMPDQHNQLITAVSAVNLRTVVVLANGAPVDMPWIDNVSSILETYLPGQAGSAVADLLLGHANPSGKLAETFPLCQTDLAADNNFPGTDRQVQYREGLYVGYRHFDSAAAPVLFPFGHGLSYTTFAYGKAVLDAGNTSISVEISNTGNTDGAEVVQLYVHAADSPVYRPEQELKGFQKVHLQAGEQCTVTFALHDDMFTYYDIGHGAWVHPGGVFQLRIGASSRDLRTAATIVTEASAVASAAARAPRPTPGKPVDDATFTTMLNKPIPAPEPKRPFHLNSSLLEIADSRLGARFRDRVVAGFMSNMGANGNDETLTKMFEEMANHMPLRAMLLFSRGQIKPNDIELMLALLNHRYLRALKLWLTS